MERPRRCGSRRGLSSETVLRQPSMLKTERGSVRRTYGDCGGCTVAVRWSWRGWLGSSAWEPSLVTAGDSWSAWNPKSLRVTATRPRSVGRILSWCDLDRWIALRSNG
ncbi:hypothetical protein V6N13_127462 [Hibiscus sabdariffa]